MAGDRKHLACDDYHVAWICPVADLELLPARLMLDEEHHTPQYDTDSDDNTYLYGSIYGHAVVIGTLSTGETSNVNASRLARDITKTFPNIRVVLLVGIGGGIPRIQSSENALGNIHLGDVVVGWPGDGKPACIYYERGRSKTDGFEIVGTVQNPNWRITNALAMLRSDHDVGKTMFNNHLARLKHFQDGSRYAHPGLEHDKLFRAACDHQGDYYSRCRDCDPSQIVPRSQRRPEDQHTFVFHSGRIATGNAVIQKAKQRDEIGSMCDGAICVEMEAAGVSVSNPCLVIRGISDYADSHKSDAWRHYAAGKAAAFARELLRKMPPGIALKSKEEMVVTEKLVEDENEALWLVPLPRPPSYVGREIQLSRINAHISSTDSCRLAICGLGGCGKTALALETAYHTREIQPNRAVFWVPAVSQTSFDQAFREIGEQLRIPNISDSRLDAKQLVKARLSDESLGPWLLIIDNVDDPDILYNSLDRETGVRRLINDLPYSRKGSIILTTRTSHIAADLADLNIVELGRLDDGEAEQLLKTRLLDKHQNQVEDYTVVAEFLGMLEFFALAIVQAVAYINKNKSSLAKYTNLFKASEENAGRLLSNEFNDQGRHPGTKNPVATTWYISFEQIQRHNALAAEYLSFMACTANTDIPALMLPDTAPELDREDAMGVLKAYRFITERQHQNEEETQEDHPEAFDIHPLVHLATRIWLKNQNEWISCVGRVVERMRELVPFGEIMTRRVWTPYLPHAKHVCDLAKLNHAESWADLIDRVARCHDALGQYRVAELEYRELLGYETSVLGERHPNTLKRSSFIGWTLHKQGKNQDAEQILRGTLALVKEVLGEEDRDTLSSMNDLALTLDEQKRYLEAEQMHRQVLELRETTLGEEHEDTLTSMHNLAGVLYSQGKFVETEQMFRKIVELKVKVIGKEHLSTLNSMKLLADTLSGQKKYQEAEELHHETLSLREKVLGKEHSHTLMSMNNLASTLDNQGKYQEAEELHRKIVRLREKALGKEHLHTLMSMNNLASTLHDQGKYEEAEELHRETLSLREKVLGVDHEHTLDSVWWVGHILRGQGHCKEALPFYERAYKGFEKVLGANHEKTRLCGWDFAIARRMADEGLSDSADDYLLESEEDSQTDEVHRSHGEELGSEDADSDDSGARVSSEIGSVAEEQEEEVEAEEEKEGAEQQSGPSDLPILGASEKVSRVLPSTSQAKTQLQVADIPSPQKDGTSTPGSARKRPPPLKAKPVALKGLPLRGLVSGDSN